MVNKFIYLCLLLSPLLVLSQDEGTSGSIFDTASVGDIVSYDASDETTTTSDDSAGQTLESSSTDDSDSADEITEVAVKDEDAESALIPEGDSGAVENDEELSNNSTDTETDAEGSESENSETDGTEESQMSLQDLLAESMVKVTKYRIDEQILVKTLNDEMKALDEYNAIIQGKVTEGVQDISSDIEEEITDDDDDDEDSDLVTSITAVAVLGLGFLFLFVQTIRIASKNLIEEELSNALYSLLADTTILVFIWCVTALIIYIDMFDEDRLDLDMILAGFAIFICFWFVQGFWLILISEAFSKRWQYHEYSIINDKELSIDTKKYAVMRSLFISPAYLPQTTESYMRSDFNFSEYLTRAMSSTLSKAFQVSWIGYGIIVIAIITWRIIIYNDQAAEMICLWIIPGVIFIINLLLVIKLNKVESQLIPKDFDIEVVIPYARHINPRFTVKNIPKPEYLKGEIPSEDQEELKRGLWFNPFKLTCAYIFVGRPPNRHEILFWFDSYGPRFLISLLQGLMVILTLWIAVIILYYIPILDDEYSNWAVGLVILACFIWIFLAFYLLPLAFRLVAITTKIELMKDREIIQQVSGKTSKKRAAGTVKIYRQFKMIYREWKRLTTGEEKSQMLHQMKKIVEESFLLVASMTNKKIHVTQLDDVLGLIGIRLQEDELRLFAKECNPDADNFITLNGFKGGIERILIGFELKPHEVTRYILRQHLKTKGKDKGSVKMEDLNDFFKKWEWHFTDTDIRDFLIEAQFLADDNGKIKISEIANMVRVDVESFSK